MSSDRLVLLDATDHAWDEAMSRARCDFYHRRPYHVLAQWHGEGDAFLAVFGNEDRYLAWPYLRRPIAGTDLFDATSVYGYAGPILVGATGSHSGGETAFLREAWRALRGAWRDQQVVSVFTSFHPLLENAHLVEGFEGDGLTPQPAVLRLGSTVSMDLGLTREERMATYEQETRRQIRKESRMGLQTRLDVTFAHLDDLVALYAQTMRRNRASERYLFSREYFARLVQAINSGAHLMIASMDDEVVAALLFFIDGQFASAHLAAASEHHLGASPLKPVFDATADAARELGASSLHLGSGRGGSDDSLFRFKKRMAQAQHDYFVGRWVLDESRYRELVDTLGAGDTKTPDGFFPAYRVNE